MGENLEELGEGNEGELKEQIDEFMKDISKLGKAWTVNSHPDNNKVLLRLNEMFEMIRDQNMPTFRKIIVNMLAAANNGLTNRELVIC